MLPAVSKNSLTILAHIVIWALLGFLLLFYPPLTWSIQIPVGFWIKQSFNLLLFLAFFYFNAYYMAPRLLFRKDKVAFISWAFLGTALILIAARIVELRLQVMEDMAKNYNRPPKSIFTIDVHLFMIALIVLAVSSGIAMVTRWREEERRRQKIEQQQISSELALLKAQINPHFFFNTLNNIYALSFSDIPVSREALLKLSRLMRFVLYDTLHDRTPVSQEISFLQDYISLMKLRLHEKTSLTVEIEKPDAGYMVAPMLLLPFIENAFKHGTSALHQSEIRIGLSVTRGKLLLEVFNQIPHEKDSYNLEGGIGLANTRKRLSLLYPDNHQLEIREEQKEKTYYVRLEINVQNEAAEARVNETELHHS